MSEESQNDDHYFFTGEAATRMNLSEPVVRELCRRGHLRAFKPHKNGRWRIPKDAVETWLTKPGPPIAWLKFRYDPRIFYPTLVLSGLIAAFVFIFALISAGADLDPATEQFKQWGLIRAFPAAHDDETLIVIATFHHPEGIADTEPQLKIRRAIQEEAELLDIPQLSCRNRTRCPHPGPAPTG